MANEVRNTFDSPGLVAALLWQFAGFVASGLLLAVFASGDRTWFLGFVALVPWLFVLNRVQSLRGALLSGIGMTITFVLAVLPWFGAAFGAYVGIDWLPAMLALVVLAPVLQPQILAFALVRHVCRRRFGPVWSRPWR